MATGNQIKNAIKGAGYTMDEAAKLLDMSRPTLYNSILNRGEIEDDVLQNVITVLKIDLQNVNTEKTRAIKHSPALDEHNYNTAHDFINFLKKRIIELEGKEKQLRDRNTELSTKIEVNLQTSIENQIVLGALVESTIKSLSEVLVKGKVQQVQFRASLHKEAFERVKALMKKGSRIEIDNVDFDIKTS